ncbi:hypothetical protein GA0111570_101219 [Raineyella antarctica]|uniref:Adhesin domain-containing protein n=1 Tax=Raineyella antarctica TaxID=1577474 RepID=A0A1G6GFJ4_9ACTN|nr:hypothetical protein [Raineyella antarctica]SDB79946.1 hypothetical protein GA0111570_101219 [Raineyella antarctica]
MDTPDLSRILADLAAGRIDTAEANRLIEDLQGTPRTEAPAPDAAGAGGSAGTPHAGAHGAADASDGDTPYAGTSSSESWSTTSGTGQVAGDVLREVFRTARHAASRAADVAAEAAAGAAGAAGYVRTDRGHAEPGQQHTAAAGATGRAAAGARRVSVRVTGKRVRIVVDPSVSGCHVTGEHVLRRNGDLIEVSAEGDFRPHISAIKLPSPLHLEALRRPRGNELLIRIHPSMALDVEVTAGNLQVANVPRLGRVRLTAGSATITGFEEVEDALVQAAVVQMSGRITTGRSRIRVESGQLSLKLDQGSNVTVVAAASIGRVTWSGQHTGSGDQVVMGNGSARLDITVVMGHAGVQVGLPAAEPSGS